MNSTKTKTYILRKYLNTVMRIKKKNPQPAISEQRVSEV